jgi:Tol biopolymer transport system component
VAVGLASGAWRVTPAPIVNGPIVYGRYDKAAGDTVIHIVRPDGTGDHVLVPGPNECPQFSQDGRLVALAMGLVKVDGTARETFPNTVGRLSLGCTTWSPDGKRLAAEGWNDQDTSANGIFLVDATNGGDATRLTTNDIGGNDIPGDYSPDGTQLAFRRAPANGSGICI